MTARVWICIIAIIVTTACGGGKSSPPAEHAESQQAEKPARSTDAPDLLRVDPAMLRDLRMTTMPVEQRNGSAEVDMLGELQVNRDAYAEVAPPIDAQVVRLIATVNANVTAGAPLAELRSPELGRARADAISAEARTRLAGQVLERKRALAAERIAPLREVQEAESQASEADASLRAATTTLRALGVTTSDAVAEDDPARFLLRSPIGGTVLERTSATGKLAQASEPMFRIADLNRLWLIVHAFERDAVQLRVKTPVRITLAAMPGREFKGTVALTGSEVEPSSRTVDVRIELSNLRRELRPGMSATAHVAIEGASSQVLSVPAAAVQRVGEQWVVFTPESEGVFRVRPVGRGRDLGGEIEIQQGLKAGETIVVEGAFLLKSEAEKAAAGGGHDHE